MTWVLSRSSASEIGGSDFVWLFRFRRLGQDTVTLVIFVESFGEGERWLPWRLDLDAGLYALQTSHVLLVREHLTRKSGTFIFCETTLLGSASCHISKKKIL